MTWIVVFLAILASSLGNIDNEKKLIDEKKLRETSIQLPDSILLLEGESSKEYFVLRKRREVPTQGEEDMGGILSKCGSDNSGGSGDGLDLCAGYSCQENLTCTCNNNANSTAVICICDNGFGGNEANCTDVNECLIASSCDINASCKNTVGTFTCSCNTGFSGNGFNCTDMDECQNSNVCPEESLCMNSVGSFSCICNEGFLKNKDGQCVTGEAMFDVTMRLNLDYKPAYADNSTDEFKAFANKIIKATDEAYKMNRNYLKTLVTSLVPGSVIANIQLVFQSAQPLPLSELKSEIENGTFGDLLVVKGSVNVTLGDKCASKPCSTNATCTDLKDGQYQCTCKRGFLGNGTHCEGFVFVNVETFVEQVFTEELKNTSSPEYRKTIRNFTEELTRLFKDEPDFVKVIILSIRNGSIIVDFEVVYRSKTPTTKTDKLQNVVDVLKKVSINDFFRQRFLIKEPPPPPVNITHDDVKETQILVKWDPPSLADQFSNTSYLISFHPIGDESAVVSKKIASIEMKNKLLNNLKSDTFYNIYLHGKNKYGEGENSTHIQVKTTRKEKDSQLVVIVGASVGAFVFVVIVVIGCVIAIRKRRRTIEINKRMKGKRGRNKRSETGFSFSSRSHPADWRRSPVDLRHLSTDPSIGHSYLNVHGNYDDVSEDFFAG